MIRLLSKETIDKIAAGEVVEKPLNVVKELMDNAIDSGASAISVEIRNGGTELIRITDNGCGISREDLPNAFTRHATSKLITADDLSHIKTMGFRGEALASIAGVSRIELVTRREEDLIGSRYVIEGGNEISVRDIGVPKGTTVIVRDLFYNVPVRRQFLKQPKTEGSYVRDIVEKAALSFPYVSLSFISDGKQVFHTSGNGKLKDVIYTIYGSDVINNMIPLEYSISKGTVTGYISNPALSRTRRDSEIYFVNGRFVRSNVIDRAIETAYEGYLMQHRFPFTVLSVEIEPEYVDVNIHPQKTEVRFSDEESVFNLIYDAVKETMSHREHIREALQRPLPVHTEVSPHIEPFEQNRSAKTEEHLKKISENIPAVAILKEETKSAFNENIYSQDKPLENTIIKAEKTEQLRFVECEAKKYYKFIGQIFNTYWMIEYEGSLYIIDQHAAHEKVNYEKLTEQIRLNEVTSQTILPVLISLNAKEAVLLEQHLDDFVKVGYEIESAGDKDFYIRAVPACLPELSEKEMLLAMIENLNDPGTGIKNVMLSEKIASMSCKAAVKGNRILTEPEMRALTDELLKCKDPYNCPHGRPVMIKFSKYELDKMFKRIV